MQGQVVLAASRTEGNILAWDLATGTSLTQYKNNTCAPQCLCTLGNDYLVAAQQNKDSLHFWTWHKDTVLQRNFMMERGVSVAATPDGMYLAVGSASGNISVWNVASGQLLATWPAHYKAVSCLSFLDEGRVLVSGGEDALLCAWLMCDCLDSTRDPNNPASRIQALYTWSEHTLPITAVKCGAGGATALVVSVSLDRTLKVWSLGTAGLLRSVQLPYPLHSLELDAGEQAVYAGGADGGVYEVSLVAEAPLDLAKGSVGQGSEVFAKLEGHTGAVHSLALSVDGELLVSGSEDGAVRVWDVRSRQTLQMLHLPAKVPVATVLVLPRPEYLQAVGQHGSGAAEGRKGPKCPSPLAALSKFQGAVSSLKPWEGSPVVLTRSPPFQAIAHKSGLLAAASTHYLPAPGTVSTNASAGTVQAVPGVNGAVGGGDVDVAMEEEDGEGALTLQEQVAVLRRRVAEAEQAALRWQNMHAELHTLCVEQVLNKAPAAQS